MFGLLFSAALLGGCKKTGKPLKAGEIHSITSEFAAAVVSAGIPPSDLRTNIDASDADPQSTDYLSITIRENPADPAYRGQILSRLLRAFGGVATAHGLTQEPMESREGILFRYLRGGFPTHRIHIHLSAPAATQNPSETHPDTLNTPSLAIILDDLGNDLAAAHSIFALPYPLTISILPDRPHSVDIAEEARRRGYQVMLHLPMQPLGQSKMESQELHPGMSPNDVRLLVDKFVGAVPGIAGVNNHQGSQSTADGNLMNELMPVLREHRFFYIDSRTTAATVAYDAARRAGVPTAFRNVPFLDDVAEVSAVRQQLQIAFRTARAKGQAIAIGHPHPATLQALLEILPQAKQQGVQLVFASELVH